MYQIFPHQITQYTHSNHAPNQIKSNVNNNNNSNSNITTANNANVKNLLQSRFYTDLLLFLSFWDCSVPLRVFESFVQGKWVHFTIIS